MDYTTIGVSAREQMAWQEKLANSAHQREIADLKAAGLNPVLSAKLGGAATPSGANDLAQLAAIGSTSGGSGSGHSSTGLNGISDTLLGQYVHGLNPNGNTRVGRVSIPNWFIQFGYDMLVNKLGHEPTVADLTFYMNGQGVKAKEEDVGDAIVNSATYQSSPDGGASSLPNGGLHTARQTHSWKEDQKENQYNWFQFHKRYPNVKYKDYVRYNFSNW